MSTSAQRDPKYRHYKPKNLAVVRIDGHDHYLGKYGSAESWEKYHRLLAERYGRPAGLVDGPQEAEPEAETLTVADMILGYYRHCERYYVKNGQATNQVRMIRLALQVLQQLYGSTSVRDFGPLKLEACQAEFVRQGLARRECNAGRP